MFYIFYYRGVYQTVQKAPFYRALARVLVALATNIEAKASKPDLKVGRSSS
ncbi:MAG: hypothetical protein V1825_04725 [Candidatus Falkowbacteria bacterium]